MLPNPGKLVVGGASVTMDYWPSPWLLTRLEYALERSDDRITANVTLRL